MAEINWINVPHYDELTPCNVIKCLKLKDLEGIWKNLIEFCPELMYK